MSGCNDTEDLMLKQDPEIKRIFEFVLQSVEIVICGKNPGTFSGFFDLFEDRSDGFSGQDRNEAGDSRGELDLDRVRGGF